MKMASMRKTLLATAAATALSWPAAPALAQSAQGQDPSGPEEPTTGPVAAIETPQAEGETVVITGSRIRRTDTETIAPVTVLDQQSLTDRGFVSASDALNQVTSMAPALAISPANGDPSGSGQQFPNLFGLGPGRTLTLVNGRRMVTS